MTKEYVAQHSGLNNFMAVKNYFFLVTTYFRVTLGKVRMVLKKTKSN